MKRAETTARTANIQNKIGEITEDYPQVSKNFINRFMRVLKTPDNKAQASFRRTIQAIRHYRV